MSKQLDIALLNACSYLVAGYVVACGYVTALHSDDPRQIDAAIDGPYWKYAMVPWIDMIFKAQRRLYNEIQADDN